MIRHYYTCDKLGRAAYAFITARLALGDWAEERVSLLDGSEDRLYVNRVFIDKLKELSANQQATLKIWGLWPQEEENAND